MWKEKWELEERVIEEMVMEELKRMGCEDGIGEVEIREEVEGRYVMGRCPMCGRKVLKFLKRSEGE